MYPLRILLFYYFTPIFRAIFNADCVICSYSIFYEKALMELPEGENIQGLFGGFDPNRRYAGDDDYKQFNLPHFIYSERMFLSMHGPVTKEEERAFTIANKATTALSTGQNQLAEKMAFHALSLDPSCVDAWRILCSTLNANCDGDTVICAIRETINFARTMYQNVFEEDGMFYSISYSRPYMRLLMDIASIAFQSEQLDVSTYAYEEIIRLNHRDNMGARSQLLSCYLKLIGRRNRYPNTKPVRTIEHAKALINCKFDEDGIFEDDNLVVRWANIIFAYSEKSPEWKKLAQEENKKNNITFKVVFGELELSKIAPGNPEFPDGFQCGNKNDDVRQHGHYLVEALRDWPDFVVDLRKLIRGNANKKFIKDTQENAPNPNWELSKEFKTKMTLLANEFLQNGRDLLTNRNYLESLRKFTFAKRGFAEAAQPSRRWYLHAPFAIVSNRATAATQLKMWNLARIDSRYTLLLKPDHPRTYLRLPKLAEAFGAKQLKEEFNIIALDAKEFVNEPNKKPIEEWKSLAKTVIGLLSIKALAYTAKNQLTNEIREQLIEFGIQDMYISVNVGSDVHKRLPWLNESDMEPEIK
ncbi:tetratricopeptide repeat protein [Histomonas meleagridis]|uniref:tetratricopeptide repeat protein n=1 Tax=Histomonas meleagridis TaxID=135588 RepID=UPI003559B54F|nr:tetratricopeptide repeat protein [Histomonas meleagridis]KAH0796613.1 tetratricopeptide repeat protein [Histomonas meleagridis]